MSLEDEHNTLCKVQTPKGGTMQHKQQFSFWGKLGLAVAIVDLVVSFIQIIY